MKYGKYDYLAIDQKSGLGRESHPDVLPDMMVRRAISGMSEDPMDHYTDGGRMIRGLGGLLPEHTWLDIGSNSGQLMVDAADELQIKSRMVALDYCAEANYLYLPDEYRRRFSFVQASADAIPMPDDSVNVATMYNMIFRAEQAEPVVREAQRVVAPEGLIAVGLNASNHAQERYLAIRIAAVGLSEKLPEVKIPDIVAPGEKFPLENLPRFMQEIGGLSPVGLVMQNTVLQITEKNIYEYLYSIKLYANALNLPAYAHSIWRDIVETRVRDSIMERMIKRNSDGELYFPDPTTRGVAIYRNDKHMAKAYANDDRTRSMAEPLAAMAPSMAA